MRKYIVYYGVALSGAGADTNPPMVCEADDFNHAFSIAHDLAVEEANSWDAEEDFGVEQEEFDENLDDFLDYNAIPWSEQLEEEEASNWGREKLDEV